MRWLIEAQCVYGDTARTQSVPATFGRVVVDTLVYNTAHVMTL